MNPLFRRTINPDNPQTHLCSIIENDSVLAETTVGETEIGYLKHDGIEFMFLPESIETGEKSIWASISSIKEK